MAWFPGAYILRALSWEHERVWGAAGRGCNTPEPFIGECAPCAFFLCESCFIRDIELPGHRPIATLLALHHVMPRAPYVRQLGVSWGPHADSGRHT